MLKCRRWKNLDSGRYRARTILVTLRSTKHTNFDTCWKTSAKFHYEMIYLEEMFKILFLLLFESNPWSGGKRVSCSLWNKDNSFDFAKRWKLFTLFLGIAVAVEVFIPHREFLLSSSAGFWLKEMWFLFKTDARWWMSTHLKKYMYFYWKDVRRAKLRWNYLFFMCKFMYRLQSSNQNNRITKLFFEDQNHVYIS